MNNQNLVLGVLGLIGSIVFTQFNSDRNFRISQSEIAVNSGVNRQIELERIKAENELAIERLNSGLCFIARYPITQNQRVEEKVPSGTFICDLNGTTGIIHNQRITNLARTSNREIIQKGLE